MREMIVFFVHFLAHRSVILGGIFFFGIGLSHLSNTIPAWVGLTGLLGIALVISAVAIFALAEQEGGFEEMLHGYPLQLSGIVIPVLTTFITLAFMYFFAFFKHQSRWEVLVQAQLIVPSWIVGYLLFKWGGHHGRGI